MNESSPSAFARLRAGLANMLASLGNGAHRLEEWSARGTRPILLTLVGIAVLAFGALGIVHESHTVAGWLHGGHHIAQIGPGPGPKPEGKPEGGPVAKPIGKPEGGPVGKPEGKPHAPPPPPVPAGPTQP